MGVEPHAGSARHEHLFDPAGTGLEVAIGVLGIDAAFDGHALAADVLLAEGQRLAGGDGDLRLDQIDAGHHFGHGMLDLNPRVDFDEVEVVVLVEDELDGARIGVVGGLDQTHGRFAHGLPFFVRQVRGRALLDQFLMPALGGAIAFPQVHHVAVMVGQDLNFDVARTFDQFLQVDAGIAEGGFGFGLRLGEGRLQRQVVGGDSHAFAAAAGGRFDQHRKADFMGDLREPDFRLRPGPRCRARPARRPPAPCCGPHSCRPASAWPRAWAR